jgi:hypothetical protein
MRQQLGHRQSIDLVARATRERAQAGVCRQYRQRTGSVEDERGDAAVVEHCERLPGDVVEVAGGGLPGIDQRGQPRLKVVHERNDLFAAQLIERLHDG